MAVCECSGSEVCHYKRQGKHRGLSYELHLQFLNESERHLEARAGIEPASTDLQSAASPLCHLARLFDRPRPAALFPAGRSTLGFLIATVIVLVPIAVLATAASVLMPGLDNADMAMRVLATEGHIPTVIGGLFLAAGLGFIVTTGTSFLLSVGGNVTYDFYLRHTKRKVSDAERLRLHRLAVLAVAALAFLLFQFFPTVLALQIHSYSIYGVAIAPVVLASFFWKRGTAAGALACMIAGTAAILVWEFVLNRPMA